MTCPSRTPGDGCCGCDGDERLTRVSRLLAWVGLALLAAFVIFLSGAGPGTVYADRRLVTIVATAVVLGAWAIVARRDPTWRPRSVLAPAIAVGLASLAISTAFSRYPRVSVEYIGFALVIAALYLFLTRLVAHPFFRTRLLALSTMLFFVISIGYVAIIVAHWVTWWTAVGGLTVPP